MKLSLHSLSFALLSFMVCSCGKDNPQPQPEPEPEPTPAPVIYGKPDGKDVYIPREFKSMDFTSDQSEYCWKHSYATDDIIIFWQKGFGDDLSKAKAYKGHKMTVDLERLATQAQEFYDLYKNDLDFIRTGSKADRYRMMVMLQYDDDGTAYGGSYDDVIGALWVTPLRTQDTRLNAIAHELGHSFQFQLSIDGNTGFGGGGIYEMTSQWMLWQANPNWIDDEKYHWDAFLDQTHLAFLHPDNMYHSPFVLEGWAALHGVTFIADLWRAAKHQNNAVTVYKNFTGLDQGAFCDETFDIYRRLITFDFPRVKEICARYANQHKGKLNAKDADGWRRINKAQEPQQYGYNGIKLTPLKAGQTATLEFQGLSDHSAAGWRYGFVAVDKDGIAHYSEMGAEKEGTISYTAGTDEKYLWLVVMGAPTAHQSLNDSQASSYRSYPYQVRLTIQ